MRVLALILAMLLGIQLSGHAKQKRALIICVGEQQDPKWANINAENDLRYVQEMLEYFKYDDISSITGKQATKQGILNAFDSFTSRCTSEDLIYVHFSGHGQRVTDIDGDEAKITIKDRYDESWIPYDAYTSYCEQDKGEKHLTDDEVAVLLKRVKDRIGPNGQILVVVDACHSGGSTRGHDGLYEGYCLRGAEEYFQIPDGESLPTTTIDEEWLTLSACKSYQTNVECLSPKVGKLTYIIYELRRSLQSMSNEEALKAITNKMNSPKYKSSVQQEPTLSGYQCELKRFFQR